MTRLSDWLMVVGALASLNGLAVAEQNPPDQDQQVETLQGWLDSLTTLQAEFEQLMFNADNQLTQTSTGSFRLSRPGKFRWDYQQPYQQNIVADGEHLWIYDADLEQVTVRRLDEGFADTPAMLLSGDGVLSEAYRIVKQYSAESIEWTELQPRASDTDFELLRLGFAEQALRVMDLVDNLGQTTRIYFSAVEIGPELESSVFNFIPPPGADVIGADDL